MVCTDGARGACDKRNVALISEASNRLGMWYLVDHGLRVGPGAERVGSREQHVVVPTLTNVESRRRRGDLLGIQQTSSPNE